jgi:UDP-3-O-acyl N-acetylglucosamine deacetylase
VQTTIKKSISFVGKGVHTGSSCQVTVNPAPNNTGFCFIRLDLPKKPVVFATAKNIFSTQGATAIGDKNVQVKTTEHLLAALWGSGINNAFIEMNAAEIPIFDGSALIFARGIQKTGIQKLTEPQAIFKITKPLRFCWQNSLALFTPHPRLSITSHSCIGSRIQHAHINFTPERFMRDIAPARTFIEKSALIPMQEIGLLQGANLGCGILLKHGVPVNTNFRMPNECARHKILDFIGDFALLGMQLQGKIELFNNNHSFHHRLWSIFETI